MKHPYPTTPTSLPRAPKLSDDLDRSTVDGQNPLHWKKEIQANFLQNEDKRSPSGYENISTSLVIYNIANHTTGNVSGKQKGLRDILFKHVMTDNVQKSVADFLVASEDGQANFNFLNNLKYTEYAGAITITSDNMFIASTAALNQDPLVETWHFNVQRDNHARIGKELGHGNVPSSIKTCGVKMSSTMKLGEDDVRVTLDLVLAITPEPHLLSGELAKVDHEILFGANIVGKKIESAVEIEGQTKTEYSNSSLVIFEKDTSKFEKLLVIHDDLDKEVKKSTTLEELVIASDKARARYEDELACLVVTFHEAFLDEDGKLMYGIEGGKLQANLVDLDKRQAVSSCALSRIFSLLALDESARSISTGGQYPLGALVRRFRSLTNIRELREFFLRDTGVSVEFRCADLSDFRANFSEVVGATDRPAQVAGDAFTHLLRLAATVYKTNTWVISSEPSNLSGLGIIRRVLRRLSGPSSMFVSWKTVGIESGLKRLGGEDKGASPFVISCGPHIINTATLFHLCVNATGPLYDLIGNLPVGTNKRDRNTLFVSANTGSRLLNQFSLSSTASNLLTMVKLVNGYFVCDPEQGLAHTWKFDDEDATKTKFAISAIKNSACTLAGAKKMIQKILNSNYIRFPSIKEASDAESDKDLVEDEVNEFLKSVFAQTTVTYQFNRSSSVTYISSGSFKKEYTVIDFPADEKWSDKKNQITNVIMVGGHKLAKLEECAGILGDKIDEGLPAFKGYLKKMDKTIRIMVATTSTASGEKKEVYEITEVFNAPITDVVGLIKSEQDCWSIISTLNALLASLRFLTSSGKEASLITCCLCQNLAALPLLAAETNEKHKVLPWMMVSNISRTVHYSIISRLAMINTGALGGNKKEEAPAAPQPLPIVEEQDQ